LDTGVHLPWHGAGTSQHTLKITIENSAESILLKLEGRVAGRWTAELKSAWDKLAPSVCGREVSIDIRDATYVDKAGIRLLGEIYRATHAEFQTSSLLTRFLADEIKQDQVNATKEVD
jgi:anti-anti-sigma regulatory factor